MPKFILYLFFILLLLPQSIFAAVTVDISNNDEGSRNDVSVKSDTTSNRETSNSIDNTTDIIIKSNGQVKEYHGKDGNIELKSDDGKSSVSVKNNSASKNSVSSSSSVTTTTNITVNSDTDSSSSAKTEASVAGIFKDNSNQEKAGLWEFLKRELKLFFSFFS